MAISLDDLSFLSVIDVNKITSSDTIESILGIVKNSSGEANLKQVEWSDLLDYIDDSDRTATGTYTAVIDLTNSNPETCITYADDAVRMTKGSKDWDSKAIFTDIKPCILKNGKVVYYLDKDNFNLREDGVTASDLTGGDGDVMIEFPKFAYKIVTDESSNTLTISVSNDKQVINSDSSYCYYAFSNEVEEDCSKFYYSAYQGSLDSDGNLASVYGATPAVSQTISAFNTLAMNKGSGYSIVGFYQLTAIQCLYIIKYGNLNGQVALGQGLINASATIKTGGTETLGMDYGDTAAGTSHMKLFGIEDFWGNVWDWIIGMTTDSSWNLVSKFPNGTESTYTTGITANGYGYISKVFGSNQTGFIGKTYSGSNSTYFSDYGYLSSGRVLIFGGRWDGGLAAGPFYLCLANSASDAGSDVGARLQYLKK